MTVEGGGFNRWTQHFIIPQKDGVWATVYRTRINYTEGGHLGSLAARRVLKLNWPIIW